MVKSSASSSAAKRERKIRVSWSEEEDKRLTDYINTNGEGSWVNLPKAAGLEPRCGKSCRLRWVNHLRPGIKLGNFTPQEDKKLIELHYLLGNKWSLISSFLPGRTDNELKNRWNRFLRRIGKDRLDLLLPPSTSTTPPPVFSCTPTTAMLNNYQLMMNMSSSSTMTFPVQPPSWTSRFIITPLNNGHLCMPSNYYTTNTNINNIHPLIMTNYSNNFTNNMTTGNGMITTNNNREEEQVNQVDLSVGIPLSVCLCFNLGKSNELCQNCHPTN
ncbi:hypothetical protein ACFE04_005148 [Oxalis oulophora]